MRMLDRCVPAAAALMCLLVVFAAFPHAQNPPPGPGTPNFTPDLDAIFQERAILAQFDASKNGRLERAERQAAREWIGKQPPFGLAAVMGRFGPPGAAPGAAGPPPGMPPFGG